MDSPSDLSVLLRKFFAPVKRKVKKRRMNSLTRMKEAQKKMGMKKKEVHMGD